MSSLGAPLVPVTLEGAHVRLEPLDLAKHWDGLRAIGLEPELWAVTTSKVWDEASLRRYLDAALADQRAGTMLPFVTIHRASGRVAGSTRFGNYAAAHKRVEIGRTWLGAEFQRSACNTEAKYVMFRHAFEVLGLQRVELKTSLVNEKSKAAMRRLGLVEEGVLRKHMLNEDGAIRHSVFFSVIDDEWPTMKARLELLLAR